MVQHGPPCRHRVDDGNGFTAFCAMPCCHHSVTVNCIVVSIAYVFHAMVTVVKCLFKRLSTTGSLEECAFKEKVLNSAPSCVRSGTPLHWLLQNAKHYHGRVPGHIISSWGSIQWFELASLHKGFSFVNIGNFSKVFHSSSNVSSYDCVFVYLFQNPSQASSMKWFLHTGLMYCSVAGTSSSSFLRYFEPIKIEPQPCEETCNYVSKIHGAETPKTLPQNMHQMQGKRPEVQLKHTRQA